MLGLSESRLKSWQRRGLIGEAVTFSFSDLIALRTLQKLHQDHVSDDRIGRAVSALRKTLSDVENPLCELKIIASGKKIAVQVAGQKMEAITGQLLFDFDAAELNNLATFPRESRSERAARITQSDLWFQRGLELEEAGAPLKDAIEAYEKAVELNAGATGAMVNLGTIYFHSRRYNLAESWYRQATDADPRYALAHFNLGNLFHEMGNLDVASSHYAKALEVQPHYADVHYNLALVRERRGDFLGAMRHWKAYLRVDSNSSWAEIARRQLDKLRKMTVTTASRVNPPSEGIK